VKGRFPTVLDSAPNRVLWYDVVRLPIRTISHWKNTQHRLAFFTTPRKTKHPAELPHAGCPEGLGRLGDRLNRDNLCGFVGSRSQLPKPLGGRFTGKGVVTPLNDLGGVAGFVCCPHRVFASGEVVGAEAMSQPVLFPRLHPGQRRQFLDARIESLL